MATLRAYYVHLKTRTGDHDVTFAVDANNGMQAIELGRKLADQFSALLAQHYTMLGYPSTPIKFKVSVTPYVPHNK